MDLNISTTAIIDQLNKNNFSPGLYIVSTPIGNLADISIRSLSALSLSSLILCEDTRTSKKLIIKYGIKNTLKSFHKFNSSKELPNIIKKLKDGLMVSIISDAGTPLISDPGESIVNKCIEENIPIYSIPGASSVLGSIVISGMDTSKFTYLGFVPQINKLRNNFLEQVVFSKETQIIFESPKRIKKLLEELLLLIPLRRVAIIRELTKRNEEVFRGSIEIVHKEFVARSNIKGEITIVIESSGLKKDDNFNKQEISALINLYSKKIKDKDIVSKLSKKLKVSKRTIYQIIIENK